MASRTVGSPQIRNRGTVGGNLGAASPAGDAHPALLAAFADVELSSAEGMRRVPAHEFYAGVKKHAGRPDELITAVWVRPRIGSPAVQQDRHPQRDGDRGRGVRPRPASRAPDGRHRHRIGRTDTEARPRGRGVPGSGAAPGSPASAVPESVSAEFGRLVATAASPIDDVRGTAAYRLHALSVMARRCLDWAWTAHRQEAG